MVKSKKMNKSTIAIIVLSLLLVVSLVLSATGAWFTDWQNGSKDTSVTFGKVDVNAGVISYSGDVEYFANYIPGAVLNVSVDIDNNSTVDTFIYVGTEFYLVGAGNKIYKALLLTAEEYDSIMKPFATTPRGNGLNITAEELITAEVLEAEQTFANLPASSDVFVKGADVISPRSGGFSWVHYSTGTGTVITAKNTYLLTEAVSYDRVTVSYSVTFENNTINYVLLQEMTYSATTGSYVASILDGAVSVVELNGSEGYSILSSLKVRSIQADFFTAGKTAQEVEDYLALDTNFTYAGQKFTANDGGIAE